MKDDYNYDSNPYSDQYRSDQMKSEQYAEAARQASLKSSKQAQPKIEFEQGDYNEQSADVTARERAFRQSLESAGYQGDRVGYASGATNQNQLDLDSLDEFDQTNPYQTKERSRRTSDGLSPTRMAKTTHDRPSKSNKILKDIFSGIIQSLTLAFSKRPMQAFHLNLHWGSLGILTLFNIFLTAGVTTLLFSKAFVPFIIGLKVLVPSAGFAFGKVFGLGLASQLASILIVIILIIILSFLLGSEKRGLKQFFQTAILSTIPYTIISFFALILAIFLPQAGLILALTGKILTFIYLYAGFQKGHPTKKNSPFWFFILIIVAVLVVQYFFVGFSLKALIP